MKKFKYIGIVITILCLLGIYSSYQISRSLYHTKADANVEYQVVGNLHQHMTVVQQFQTENDKINEVTIRIQSHLQQNPLPIEWSLVEDGQILKKEQLLLKPEMGDRLQFDVKNILFHPTKVYQLVIKGDLGALFLKTRSGENSKGIIIDGVYENSALIAKIVYGNFHVETFVVLLGLLIYISAFMALMTKLFK